MTIVDYPCCATVQLLLIFFQYIVLSTTFTSYNNLLVSNGVGLPSFVFQFHPLIWWFRPHFFGNLEVRSVWHWPTRLSPHFTFYSEKSTGSVDTAGVAVRWSTTQELEPSTWGWRASLCVRGRLDLRSLHESTGWRMFRTQRDTFLAGVCLFFSAPQWRHKQRTAPNGPTHFYVLCWCGSEWRGLFSLASR